VDIVRGAYRTLSVVKQGQFGVLAEDLDYLAESIAAFSPIHREHDEPLRADLTLDAVKDGKFLPARRTPRRPEVDHDNPTAILAQADFVAVDVLTDVVGWHVIDFDAAQQHADQKHQTGQHDV